MTGGLRERWPLRTGTEVRDELLEAYADRARGYHDLRHLEEVLDRLDELAAAGEPFARTLVLLAAWFHDGVYDDEPGAEDRSANWAERALPALGVPPEQVAEVARLVRLTELHRPEAADRNGCALTDADLAILAASPERYAEYVADVRREYSHLSDEVFRTGRAGVLRQLAAKDTLFHTGHARARWEGPARENLAHELDELERS